MDLRQRDPEGEPPENVTKEQEGQMTTLVERMRVWGDELNREWLEKGREEGDAKGLERGERAMVLRMVTRRFGPEAAEELAPFLESVSDPERLATILAKVFECDAADELVAWARGGEL